MAIGDMHKKLVISRVCSRTDRHTQIHTDIHTDALITILRHLSHGQDFQVKFKKDYLAVTYIPEERYGQYADQSDKQLQVDPVTY